MRQFLHKYTNAANMQIPLWKNIFYFFVRSARFSLRGGIYLALQGFLTRAECRVLRMTAENGGARQGLDYPTLYVLRRLAEESGEA